VTIADLPKNTVDPGHKGMFAVVIGLYDDKDQAGPLSARGPRYPLQEFIDMVQVMTDYQDNLQALGWKGLGLRSSRTLARKGRRAVRKIRGAEKLQTVSRDGLGRVERIPTRPRHANPGRSQARAAVRCRVHQLPRHGWNPQEFFPYVSGFESLEATPHLAGNSCENCHGPGTAHVAAEAGDDEGLRDRLRELMAKPPRTTTPAPSATMETTARTSISTNTGCDRALATGIPGRPRISPISRTAAVSD